MNIKPLMPQDSVRHSAVPNPDRGLPASNNSASESGVDPKIDPDAWDNNIHMILVVAMEHFDGTLKNPDEWTREMGILSEILDTPVLELKAIYQDVRETVVFGKLGREMALKWYLIHREEFIKFEHLPVGPDPRGLLGPLPYEIAADKRVLEELGEPWREFTQANYERDP